MPKFPHTSVGSVEGSSHASNQLDSFRRFDTTLDLSQTDTAMANTALAQRRAVKSYPRRTDVRATALTLPPLSSAAPRHTPRRARWQLIASQWKPTITAIRQYLLGAAVYSRVAHSFH